MEIDSQATRASQTPGWECSWGLWCYPILVWGPDTLSLSLVGLPSSFYLQTCIPSFPRLRGRWKMPILGCEPRITAPPLGDMQDHFLSCLSQFLKRRKGALIGPGVLRTLSPHARSYPPPPQTVWMCTSCCLISVCLIIVLPNLLVTCTHPKPHL